MRGEHLRGFVNKWLECTKNFTGDHAKALHHLLQVKGLAPAAAIEQITGLDCLEARDLVAGLTKEEILNLTHIQRSLLIEWKSQGLAFADLQQWEKAEDEFGPEHADAMKALVLKKQLAPAAALKQLNKSSRARAQTLASQLWEETAAEKAAVALVDLRALLIGGYGWDCLPDKEAIRPGINNNLIAVLKAAGIKHLYLSGNLRILGIDSLCPEDCAVTDMARWQACIDLLQEEGFKVHGVLTSADPAWSAPAAAKKGFMKR